MTCTEAVDQSLQTSGQPWNLKWSEHLKHARCAAPRHWTSMEVKMVRDTVSVESGHTGKTVWTLRELMRHVALSWVHISG